MKNEKYLKTSIIINIILRFGFICFALESLFNCIYLTIKGKSILNVLKNQEIVKIDERYERKVGLYLTITQIVVNIIINLTYFIILSEDINENRSVFEIIILSTTLYLASNLNSNTISLFAYKCFIISYQIQNIHKFNTKPNLNIIFYKMNIISESVKQFDNLFSCYNFIMLSIYSIICISSICALSLNIYDSIPYEVTNCIVVFVRILSICLISDMIPKSVNKFIDNLNSYRIKTTNTYNLTIDDKLVLNEIKDYENYIYLTLFNIFKLNTNTFISCLSLIITYSIVLIQTTQPTMKCACSNIINCTNN